MKIYTHGGNAHRDEYLAIGVLMASKVQSKDLDKVQVIRQRPSQKELDNPDVWVIDCGEELNPKLKNFDHHQLKEHKPVCSLSYILNYLDPELLVLGRDCLNWLVPTEVNDSKGPRALTELLGLTCFTEQVLPVMSPIEKAILASFSEEEEVTIETKRLMYNIGKSILDELYNTIDRIKLIKENYEFKSIKGLEIIDISRVPDSETLPPYAGVEAFCKRYHPEVAIIVDKERTGAKTALEIIRRNNHPKVDMRRASNLEMIRFTEKTGRAAKTKTVECQWVEAVKISIQ